MRVGLWLTISIIAATLYLLLFKKFTQEHNFFIFILAAIFGLLSIYSNYRVYSQSSLGASYGIITGTVVLLVFLGSVIFFQEKITVSEVIALFLIVSGVVLLSLVS